MRTSTRFAFAVLAASLFSAADTSMAQQAARPVLGAQAFDSLRWRFASG